jgi:hypothetical protein
MRNWTPPSGFRRTIELSDGKAQIRVSHRFDTIDVKLRALGHLLRDSHGNILDASLGRYLRDKEGRIKTEKYTVPSTHIQVKLADGTVLRARSCCKPPDNFNAQFGIERAVKRLGLKDDKGRRTLASDDRRKIVECLCPYFFKKRLTRKPKVQVVLVPLGS